MKYVGSLYAYNNLANHLLSLTSVEIAMVLITDTTALIFCFVFALAAGCLFRMALFGFLWLLFL